MTVEPSERDFTGQIIDLLHHFGWHVAHFRPARTAHGWRTPVQADGAGFPDLICAHPRRGVLAAELKTSRGKLRPEQEHWLDLLTRAGLETHLWRPDDFDTIADRARRDRTRSP